MDLELHLDGVKALVKVVLFIFVIMLAVGMAVEAYEGADAYGWIPHSGQLQVIFPLHGWEVGEYVDCYATKVVDNSPVILGCEGNHPGTEIREMDVKLWAKVSPTKDGIAVKCQRSEDSITCRLDTSQGNASPAP